MISKEDFEAWLASGHDIEFDMWAQNIDDWKFLSDVIPGLVVSSAGGAMYQAEGLLHGLPFYFKNRHDVAVLKVGEADGDAYGPRVLYSASVESPGMIGHEGFARKMMELVPKLEKAPFLWQFPARKIEIVGDFKIVPTPEYELYAGWGTTPEEGYESTRELSVYLLENGFTAEIQKRMWEARDIHPVPSNVDDRIWPNPEPNFIVK